MRSQLQVEHRPDHDPEHRHEAVEFPDAVATKEVPGERGRGAGDWEETRRMLDRAANRGSLSQTIAVPPWPGKRRPVIVGGAAEPAPPKEPDDAP